MCLLIFEFIIFMAQCYMFIFVIEIGWALPHFDYRIYVYVNNIPEWLWKICSVIVSFIQYMNCCIIWHVHFS